MLEDLINQQWQALAQLIRGSKRLGQSIVAAFFARKPPPQKPSLAVAIGKRRKANALEEYRRRFASTAGQENPPPAPLPAAGQDFRQPPLPAIEPVKTPERAGKTERQRGLKPGGGHKRAEPDWASRLDQSLDKAWGLLVSALLRGYRGIARFRSELIVAAACAILFAGGYVYRNMKADSGTRRPPHIAQAAQPATQDVQPASVDDRPKKPAAVTSTKKLYYDRLPSGESEAAAAPAEVPPVRAALAEPSNGGAPVSEGERSAAAPPPPPAAPAEVKAASGPTVVRSERYLPDGTRIDPGRPAAVPSVASSGVGEARAPILTAAAEPIPAPVEGAAPETGGAPAAAPPAQAPAEPASPAASGYFAQVKSDQNRNASEAELAAVVEKYKAVLREVPLIIRQADLKDRGMWFRVLAGPVKSHDDAENLCRRLKTAGLQACIVQRLD